MVLLYIRGPGGVRYLSKSNAAASIAKARAEQNKRSDNGELSPLMPLMPLTQPELLSLRLSAHCALRTALRTAHCTLHIAHSPLNTAKPAAC